MGPKVSFKYWVAGIFVLALGIAVPILLLGGTLKKGKIPVVTFKISQPVNDNGNAKRPFEGFSMKKVSTFSYHNDCMEILLKADKIVQKRGRWMIFVLNNFTEIHISNLHIEINPDSCLNNNQSSLSFKATSEAVFDLIKTFAKNRKDSKAPKDSKAGSGGFVTDYNLVTSIHIDRITAINSLNGGLRTVVSADKAFINANQIINLIGHFSFTSSKGERLEATRAILSSNGEKVILPNGYILKTTETGTKTGEAASFAINEMGELLLSNEYDSSKPSRMGITNNAPLQSIGMEKMNWDKIPIKSLFRPEILLKSFFSTAKSFTNQSSVIINN